MQIIHHMTIDMAKPLPVVPAAAVQGDGNTRILRLTLLENGEPWAVPAGVSAAVAFRKSDGTKGLYDTLPDGTKAVSMEANTVSAVLAPQALSCPGEVSAAVAFYDSRLSQLATFPFTLKVAPNPSAGQGVSNDYYRFSTMEAVSEAVEAALASMEESKWDFLTKAEEALAVVHDTAAENAPAIVCEKAGESITASDSADRPLKGLTLCGKTTQSGTPTPENPVPLESVGAGGSISVTVGEQTLTVSTGGGLPGIPVESGGNYTDENGQQWLCDEINFARGVYVKRTVLLENFTKRRTFTNTDQYAATTESSLIGRTTKAALCTVMDLYVYNTSDQRHFYVDTTSSCVFVPKGFDNSGNVIKVLAAMKEPIETPMSSEELAQYAALHTNKPNTTVFNDGGAGVKLSYVADTKTYIDGQIAAISKAILL